MNDANETAMRGQSEPVPNIQASWSTYVPIFSAHTDEHLA
jgi:hypothetical protein